MNKEPPTKTYSDELFLSFIPSWGNLDHVDHRRERKGLGGRKAVKT